MISPSANPSFREKHRPNSEAPNPDAPGNSSVESRAKLRETTEIPRKRHLTAAAWCEDKWTMWTTAPQNITKSGGNRKRGDQIHHPVAMAWGVIQLLGI